MIKPQIKEVKTCFRKYNWGEAICLNDNAYNS